MRSDAGILGQQLAHISQIAQDHESQTPIVEDGIVMAGSYDPADGTVSVGIGDTFACLPEDEIFLGYTPPLTYKKVRLATSQIGDQYGPVGGERVDLHPTYGGQQAVLKHGPDDSPQAPAGERWIMQTPLATIIANGGKLGGYTQGLKFTNDGATAGDGLGGMTRHSSSFIADSTAGGYKQIFSDTERLLSVVTPEGHTMRVDDAAGTWTFQTAQAVLGTGGSMLEILEGSTAVKQYIDATLGHFDVVASAVGLGGRFNALPALDAAITQGHLVELASLVDNLNLSVVIQTVSTLAEAGAFAAGFNLSTYLSQIVLGFFSKLGVPNGSPYVRLLS